MKQHRLALFFLLTIAACGRDPVMVTLGTGDEPDVGSDTAPDVGGDLRDEPERPVASIDQPADGDTVHCTDAVAFAATCADPGGQDVEHAWMFGNGASSTDAAPTYVFDAIGSYSVMYACTNEDGATSDAVSIDLTVTNEAPAAVTTTIGGPVALGRVVDLTLDCPDTDDDDVTGTWSDGTTTFDAVTTVVLDAPGSVTFEGTCTDPCGAASSVTVTFEVLGPPSAVYLSTEAQLEYDELLLAQTPGAPQTLNQPLFAPAGRIFDFFVAGPDTYYVADHTIAGRRQLYRANPADRQTPFEVGGLHLAQPSITTAVSPDRTGFIFAAPQSLPTQDDLLYVDATAATPTPVTINPVLAMDERIVGAQFSATGRYVAFQLENTASPTPMFDTWVVDLDNGVTPVKVDDDAGTRTRISLVFSPDDRYLAVGDTSSLQVVDLTTLSQATLSSATLRAGIEFAFVESLPLLAYSARPAVNQPFALNVVDVAAALAGSGQLDEVVFSTAVVSTSRNALAVCGDIVAFAATETGDFSPEIFAVDLAQWVADFRAAPGSQTAPIKIHEDLELNDRAQLPVFDAACTGAAHTLSVDHDDNSATPPQYQLVYTDLSALSGSPTILTASTDFIGGGRLIQPNIAFSPNGTMVGYTTPTRVFVTGVVAPAPVEVASSVPGQIDDFFWRDNDVVIAHVEANPTTNGIYLWNRTTPGSATLLSDAGPDIQFMLLNGLSTGVSYMTVFSALVAEIDGVSFSTPGVVNKLNGDGNANGATIGNVQIDQSTVVFSAINENFSQNHLYSASLAAPGQVTEIYPGPNQAGTTAGRAEVLPTKDAVVFVGGPLGARRLFRAPIDGSSAPTEIDTSPATNVTDIRAVSPNGDWVLLHVAASGAKTFLVNVETNAPAVEVATQFTTSGTTTRFSRTGRWVTFALGTAPTRLMIVDTTNPGAGATALTPEALPTQLPTSSMNANLRNTTGSRDVAFGPGDDAVYYAYDDTYALNLAVVRRSLPALGAEEAVTSPVVAPDDVASWALTDDGEFVVYQKHVAASSADRLYAVATADLSESALSPAFATGQGVINYQLYGRIVTMLAREPVDQLYAASLDGDFEPFAVNAALETEDDIIVAYGAVQEGPRTFVAYTARETGDASSTIRIASHDAGVVTRRTVSPTAPDEPIAVVDGAWLWVVHTEAGACDPLSVTLLADPAGTLLPVGGLPIATGCARLPFLQTQ